MAELDQKRDELRIRANDGLRTLAEGVGDLLARGEYKKVAALVDAIYTHLPDFGISPKLTDSTAQLVIPSQQVVSTAALETLRVFLNKVDFALQDSNARSSNVALLERAGEQGEALLVGHTVGLLLAGHERNASALIRAFELVSRPAFVSALKDILKSPSFDIRVVNFVFNLFDQGCPSGSNLSGSALRMEVALDKNYPLGTRLAALESCKSDGDLAPEKVAGLKDFITEMKEVTRPNLVWKAHSRALSMLPATDTELPKLCIEGYEKLGMLALSPKVLENVRSADGIVDLSMKVIKDEQLYTVRNVESQIQDEIVMACVGIARDQAVRLFAEDPLVLSSVAISHLLINPSDYNAAVFQGIIKDVGVSSNERFAVSFSNRDRYIFNPDRYDKGRIPAIFNVTVEAWGDILRYFEKHFQTFSPYVPVKMLGALLFAFPTEGQAVIDNLKQAVSDNGNLRACNDMVYELKRNGLFGRS